VISATRIAGMNRVTGLTRAGRQEFRLQVKKTTNSYGNYG
jgi:hypothetical protein